MRNRLEDLWKAADDGASTPLEVMAARDDAELEQIMDAWFQERHLSIEFEILLKQSRRMIAQLLATGLDQSEVGRKARRLLREIERSLRKAKANGL